MEEIQGRNVLLKSKDIYIKSIDQIKTHTRAHEREE